MMKKSLFFNLSLFRNNRLTETDYFSLFDIPNDILLMIFEFLDTDDLQNVVTVCSFFYQLAAIIQRKNSLPLNYKSPLYSMEYNLNANYVLPITKQKILFASGKKLFVFDKSINKITYFGEHKYTISKMIRVNQNSVCSADFNGILKLWSLNPQIFLKEIKLTHDKESLLDIATNHNLICVTTSKTAYVIRTFDSNTKNSIVSIFKDWTKREGYISDIVLNDTKLIGIHNVLKGSFQNTIVLDVIDKDEIHGKEQNVVSIDYRNKTLFVLLSTNELIIYKNEDSETIKLNELLPSDKYIVFRKVNAINKNVVVFELYQRNTTGDEITYSLIFCDIKNKTVINEFSIPKGTKYTFLPDKNLLIYNQNKLTFWKFQTLTPSDIPKEDQPFPAQQLKT